MTTVKDPMRDKITLHGLGFIQVQLTENTRLHVWHPELPRRRCFEHSKVHNHRWGFRSRVLVGRLKDRRFEFEPSSNGNHMRYEHGSARGTCGGRGWEPVERGMLIEHCPRILHAGGSSYHTSAYDYHTSEPMDDGIVVTLLDKEYTNDRPASSICRLDIEPETDFDRYQLAPVSLMAIVSHALCHGGIDGISAIR